MKTYVVGGAVRDALLGLPVKDRDHVVVGATPEEMVRAGYRPVGKDFPVFLHPQTQEEYALARTERKTAPGYKGFVFHTSSDVTLEEDLVRRDLTINAIARDDDGVLVDPYHGQRDLQDRIFRHVSDAFAEDPVRILRLARFAARFPDFRVAPETNALMQRMVREGEVDALVPERVWQEVARGLMEQKPSRMLQVLRDCGALSHILPELGDGSAIAPVLDRAAALELALPERFAAMLYDQPLPQVEQASKRLKVPTECRDLAVMTARDHASVGQALALDAAAMVALFERCDGYRKPARFAQFLAAAGCALAAGEAAEGLAPQRALLARALDAARAVNAGEIAQRAAGQPQQIPELVRAARVDAVRATLGAREHDHDQP
ncbi:multifunctional CCA tRNA nucleotidyl transferase/2'3'-cyclic phosphodiesterase/2'nucleotidase/phosphatase [Pseudoduganella sp.]|uniref:multifunctional CCA tRNA nucleotidyl transferase/2'3'-cyclic phosphodiesterase/2'nucleotidase/phosphatase n=1 Tax=Pseudoduganella sp. TaxID=1880898 RepID=UPI0035B0DEA8